MNNLQSLIKENTTLKKTTESGYPERYQYLDEDPMTVPSERNPSIDKNVL